MQKSNAPTQLTVAFASGSGAGPINTIPVAASGTAGAASWTTGFTTVNMEPIGSGGIPPFGADFNGLFNALSNAQIWEQAGYLFPYSSAFSTAIGGYPAGASLQMASGLGLWINLADNNTTNPDTSAGSNWIEMCANAGGTSIALSGSTVTPTENQLGVRLLVLTGALTAACKLVLPLRNGASWKILNNTTGGQTITVGGATGSAVSTSAGAGGAQEVFSDGTNYYTTSFNGAGVYLPIAGNAVSASAWANARTIAMTGDVTWSVSADGSTNVTAASAIAAGAVTLAKMANLTSNTLLGNPNSTAAAPQAIPLINGLVFIGGSLGLANIVATSATIGGNIQSNSGQFILNATAPNDRYVYIDTNSVARWRFGGTADAESGSNAGTNWAITAFTDTGTYLGNALLITRATLAAAFGGAVSAPNLTSTGDTTVGGTLHANGNVSVGGTLGVAGLSTLASLTVTGATNLNGTTTIPNGVNIGTGGGYLYEATAGTGNITLRTGTSSSYAYFGFGANGVFNVANGGITAAGSIITSTGVIQAPGNIVSTAGSVQALGGSFVNTGSETDVFMGYSNSLAYRFYFAVSSNGWALNCTNSTGNYVGSPISVNQAGTQVTINANLQVNGTISNTGTVNFYTSSSDADLKSGIEEIAPQPLHRGAPWTKYHWKADGAYSEGPIAQHMQSTKPLYVRDQPGQTIRMPDGTERAALGIAETRMALEQAWWAGTAIDELAARVAALEACSG